MFKGSQGSSVIKVFDMTAASTGIVDLEVIWDAGYLSRMDLNVIIFREVIASMKPLLTIRWLHIRRCRADWKDNTLERLNIYGTHHL